MLAEAYEHWKEEFPTHGIEIIFVSSDRDQPSFDQYYGSMPWMALPFSARHKKEEISMRYGVRGIPSFVILDAMSGEIVSNADQSRGEVMNAAQRSGDEGLDQLLQTWLNRIPNESKVRKSNIDFNVCASSPSWFQSYVDVYVVSSRSS